MSRFGSPHPWDSHFEIMPYTCGHAILTILEWVQKGPKDRGITIDLGSRSPFFKLFSIHVQRIHTTVWLWQTFCVLCSLIDIIEPSTIRGAQFHFVLYSLIDIMVSPKTMGLDFFYAIVLTSLHGHILGLNLSECFLDCIPLNMVALVVLCINWPCRRLCNLPSYVSSSLNFHC